MPIQMPVGTVVDFNTIPSKYLTQRKSLKCVVFTDWKFWVLGFSPMIRATKGQFLNLFACYFFHL